MHVCKCRHTLTYSNRITLQILIIFSSVCIFKLGLISKRKLQTLPTYAFKTAFGTERHVSAKITPIKLDNLEGIWEDIVYKYR